MLRELKFRVWDKSSQNFLFSDIVGKHPFHFIAGLESFTVEASHPDYVIQQYTGLKDKNGVEIYEGDIVRSFSELYTNENFVGKVIYDECCYLTWIHKNDIRGLWGYDDIEVIGNIFEDNKQLEV